jgi:uncharacterized protein YdeI (YjbR/CyaY-like superfamily)
VPVTNLKTTHPKTRKAWRKWLEKNHTTSPGVWLIYDKKSSGKAKLVYNDAVEEALCFGWIDSTLKSLDAEHFMQRFTPRKPKSGWSGLNKKRITKMIAEGLMTKAGLEKIEAAKKDGSWESFDHLDALRLPADFKKALFKNKKAKANFENFPPFSKKQFLFHIQQAKTEFTRKQRIRLCVRMAAANKKPSVGGFKM